MIDELSTFLCFGYYSDDLTKSSHKKIWAACDECGKYRLLSFRDYKNLCRSCVANNFKHSEEAKQKIGNFNRGKNVSIKTRKKQSDSHIGIKPSEEMMKNLSIRWLGEKNPNWNSNLTDKDRKQRRLYSEYYEWRTAVFERDSYICQICDDKGGKLNAHHIESYANNPDLRTELLNGITLCKIYHKNFHHCYGYGNNTREQFIEFMGSI